MSRAWWRGNARVIALVAAAGILLSTPRETARAQGPAATGWSPGLYDTLTALCGTPRAVRYGAIPAQWLAMYSTRLDEITISAVVAFRPRHVPGPFITRETRETPDFILSHEFGHRYDFRRWNVRAAEWMRPTFFIWAESKYANWSLTERWAEAFANAIDFLRWTAAGVPDRQLGIEALRQREAFTPGFVFVVRWLLLDPIYAQHPLNAPAR